MAMKRFKRLVTYQAGQILAFFFVDKSSKFKLFEFGSDYGKWHVEGSKELRNITLISGGLGEDASFDLEYSARYSSRVVFVDPTERAAIHYSKIINQIGSSKSTDYSIDGNQQISSYDLSNIRAEQLIFVQSALWGSKSFISLYPPDNENYVSYSILKPSLSLVAKRPKMVVPTVSVRDLVLSMNIGHRFILKIDIEGAELATIKGMLKDEIYPMQILVEFEFLRIKYAFKILKVLHVHMELKRKGYQLVHLHQCRNATYVLI
jgi:FkbM family methyltransferase